MQRLFFLIPVICILIHSSHAQFTGGNGDAYDHATSGTITLNEQDFYCSGGSGDGYNTFAFQSSLNQQSFYCSGGNSAGYSADQIDTILNEQFFYCSGGNNDGYTVGFSGTQTPNNAVFYCSGGNSDGFGKAFFTGTLNIQDLYCSGGVGDGYSMFSLTGPVNEQSVYCEGGIRDGYNYGVGIQPLNDQVIYCTGDTGDGAGNDHFLGFSYGQPLFCLGSEGDGFSYSIYQGSIFGEDVFCLGGDGDGYNPGMGGPFLLGKGIWTGLDNSDWGTADNWTHLLVPGPDDDVYIPGSCPNYPDISGSFGVSAAYGSIICRRLEVGQGGFFNHSGSLDVNGELVVSGTYVCTINSDNSQRINAGGEMRLMSTGHVKLGNQSSGSGVTDLKVNNGGALVIIGGTFEIDDKLLVYSGGSLDLDGGTLKIHKFGEGTPLNSDNPGDFWIENGAHGSVRYSTIEICGRESDGNYHSLTIDEPSFEFKLNSTVKFTHGISGNHYNCGISVTDGVPLQHLEIDKPGTEVTVESNLTVEQTFTVTPGSVLKLSSGNTIVIGE